MVLILSLVLFSSVVAQQIKAEEATALNATLASVGCFQSPSCMLKAFASTPFAWTCLSFGVLTCDNNGSIAFLNLSSNGLSGTFASTIGALTSLTVLDYSNNAIVGISVGHNPIRI